MNPSIVHVERVSHRFGENEVLKEVSLDIQPSSFTVLLGPSGSGKTTLLSILGGFLVPTSGRVLIAGKDCTATAPAKRPTTTVFQDYALFPHMTVGSNVGFGLRMRGVAKAERLERAAQALRMVGLEAMTGRKPHQLSGGQRQRVALARALVVDPAVLLLDEPLGALDLKLRRQMQDELKAIQRRANMAFVHVTHDQEEAMALADEIVIMNDGRIEDQGPPERLYAQPRTRFSATFMGESTLIEGTIANIERGDVLIETPRGHFALKGAGEAGQKVTIAIRPENMLLSGGRGLVALGRAAIKEIVFQGSFKRIEVQWEGTGRSATIKAPSSATVQPHDTIELFCRAEDMIVLAQ